MDYTVIEHKEILYEVLSDAIAEFDYIIKRDNLKNSDNKVIKMKNRAIELHHDILGIKYTDLDSILKVKDEFLTIRKFLDEVGWKAESSVYFR